MSASPVPTTLEDWGWNDDFRRQLSSLPPEILAQGEPARIVVERRLLLEAVCADGVVDARIGGRLRHRKATEAELPAIGDWVLIDRSAEGPATIIEVLERKSSFVRRAAGTRTEAQVLAANVDTLFVVMGLDGDFSVRRLERYLLTAAGSGAEPVVVLNKADLTDELDEQLEAVAAVSGETAVVVTSCATGRGIDELERWLAPRRTVALLGSSGVGKSTLVNTLAGEEVMPTQAVRQSDDTGQHTTSHRQLLRLPNGALLIDNPGIRELQLWQDEEALDQGYSDIAEIAAACRFRDCKHRGEPGCAVLAAIDDGTLDAERLQSYLAMRKELEHLERQRDKHAQLAQKRRWRNIHRAARKFKPRSHD